MLMAKITWIAIVAFAGVVACGVTALLPEQGSRSYKFLEQPKPVKTTALPPDPVLDLSKNTTIPITDKTPVRTISIPRPESVVTLPPPAIPETVIVERRIVVGHHHKGGGGCRHGGTRVAGGKAPGKTWHCE